MLNYWICSDTGVLANPYPSFLEAKAVRLAFQSSCGVCNVQNEWGQLLPNRTYEQKEERNLQKCQKIWLLASSFSFFSSPQYNQYFPAKHRELVFNQHVKYYKKLPPRETLGSNNNEKSPWMLDSTFPVVEPPKSWKIKNFNKPWYLTK